MTKKIGITLASLAVIVLIGASGYALAGEKTCTKTKQASNTATTAKVDAKAAADKNAKSGCAATCATPCTAGAKASATTKTDAVKTVSTAHPATCTGTKNASGKATCTEAEKAACKAAGIDCSTQHGSTKNASMVKKASAGCSATCSSHASKASACTPAEQAACKASGKTCTSGAKKASYAANVYKVENGVKYAVADGKRFVVTGDTPYTEVGNARYYFADENCAVKCPTKMSSMTSKYNAEAASMTTREANVKIIDGKKMATCCDSDKTFEVTASTPSIVMNGEKVYFCNEKCAQHRMAMTF
jgi:hypothetical protein